MKIALFLSATLLVPALPAAAQTEPWQPPTLTITRYDEDWSAADRTDEAGRRWTAPLKHITLDAAADAYLVTGIELRARNEKYDNNLWGAAEAPDDGYLWLRAMPYADLHVGRVRAFVQPIIAYAAGVSPSSGPVDQTRVDMLQSFADVSLPLGGDASLTLRGGRELLSLGTERLVGTRYGPNVPLAFDGGRATLKTGRLTANILYVRPVQAGPHSFDDRTSDSGTLWGIYATRTLPIGSGAGIDLYYLGYRNDRATFDQGIGGEKRHTLGGRFFGKSSDWHWNIEAIYQFGHFSGASIRAWSVGSEVGRSFGTLPLQPAILARLNIVSGDRDPTDGRLGTFNAMFPKGKYFGELSPVGPYNIVNAQILGTVQLGGGFSSSLAGVAYWRESLGDGVYDIPGNLVRAADGARGRFIGKQIEATLAWQASPELELSSSLSAFQPGSFIEQTGPARTITMLGLEANFRF